eukprot:CCRYP_000157-RA/>CCRYP_000157-RA protein AED:0.19 eAED:0.58 QI:0/0/0/1/0/0/3/0/273
MMLSYFMINRLPSWDVVNKLGNPTKSTVVTDLIAFVKKKETCGNESSIDSAFEHSEFQQTFWIFSPLAIIQLQLQVSLSSNDQVYVTLHHPAKDAYNIYKSSLKQNSEYPWTLVCTLHWSKNVPEQHSCSHQIMLGWINPGYFIKQCQEALTSLWLFSDVSTTATSPVKEISKELDHCKGGLYTQIKHIVKSLTFVRDPAVANSCNSLANHSTKKYGKIHKKMKWRCVPTETMDCKARWKSKRIQESYIDTVLPCPVIKAASALCFGGICSKN